ncbi:sugar transferase [Lacicoccus alkaliphilus]|uniref:Sugar transferase involved in LPS biosynthesis (Colanic, teichoic acid) n=1 Tax=Lacicoccus alkaliphilus DSM 16010 TaxID=1123231 RepID=A0A1M7CV25_9BACL|nr:sugar transferase [Salinicoccus alkaliphilus]SHL71096.1 Sugar transferase involved in LPS biosynthesis (colanic, teichoic acid) [Salinicoccus alkaliphilus DSM 16010]
MKDRHLKIKRGIDVFVSALLLVVLSPLLIATAVTIILTMPGPVFFLQQRVGRAEAPYVIFKFRSMKADAEAENNFAFDKDEERLTAFGRTIRRLKVDELPQLFNVLKGDMSLVGPRPTIEQQTRQYNAREKQRLGMRPGMTGFAQVNGNTSLSWEERIEYDIEYVRRFSLFLDMKILLKTLLIVVLGEERFKK